MSWQSYIDQTLLGSGRVKDAAIIGAGDGSIWATSPGMNLAAGEPANIVKLFSDPSLGPVNGIKVGTVKYMYLRGDNTSLYGKKGAGGCVCVKTAQCVVIGLYDENIQPGQCAVTVEKLGDYLRDAGY